MRREWRSDRFWIALWPLAMGIGIWGVGLIYQSLAQGRPTFWVGLALFAGGSFFSGRWIAQARHLHRQWKGGRHGRARLLTPDTYLRAARR